MSNEVEYPLKGSCNCGFIEYEVTEPFLQQAACHCTQCQKHTQSAFSLVGILNPGTFKLVRGELKKWTKAADSGNRVDCYFCPECGNRIYHENAATPGSARLKLGTLDNTDVIDPQVHVWVSMKQRWFQLPAGVQVFDTQPDFAPR
jgi:hypothetical protein